MSAPFVPPVGLDNCPSEPIHRPGSIQPHGVLIALGADDHRVEVVSANIGEWFGIGPDAATGASLEMVVGPANAKVVNDVLSRPWVVRFDELALAAPSGPPMAAIVHRSNGRIVIEAERDPGHHGPTIAAQLRDASTSLHTSSSVMEVADDAVRSVQRLTGFDHVMMYRFDREWNGEVIAEARTSDLNTFLGLHCPASDIPEQARALCRQNWLRCIPDVGYRAVPLVPAASFSDKVPLDLSHSTLRSVSPTHVEYLTNMGVRASMSISVLVHGELWGLLACHHYRSTHLPPIVVRNAAEHLGQLVWLRIGETAEADGRTRVLALSALADAAADVLVTTTSTAGVAETLLRRENELLKLADADGVEVVMGDRRVAVDRPAGLRAELLAPRWDGDGLIVTDRAYDRIPTLRDLEGDLTAAGILAVALSSDGKDFACWVRDELVRAVDWGGDPANAKLITGDGPDVRLSPRTSFARWRDVVRGGSRAWHEAELRAAQRFAHHLTSTLARHERASRAVAEDLQRVMLPSRLPDVVGLTFDAHYAPAETALVGGDWYDVVLLDEHHVAVSLGDVAGHGLAAAADMAQLRNGLRAYLLDDGGPAHALRRLDEMIERFLPTCLVSIACAVIDRRDGTSRIAHAGHMPTLVVGAAGSRYLPLPGGAMLGSGGRPPVEQTFVLGVGESMVLYSDGLIERRGEMLDPALARLAVVAEEVFLPGSEPGRAAELATRLRSSASDDDVTIVVARRG